MADEILRPTASPALGSRSATQVDFDRMRRGVIAQKTGRVGFNLVSVAGFVFLWAPILLLIIFSFNDSRQLNEFRGFTFQWYVNIFNDVVGTEARFSTELMLNSVRNSLLVSLTATVIATTLGTMVALSLARGRFLGRRFLDSLLFLPVVIPEITQGVSLAMFFVIAFDVLERVFSQGANFGFTTIIIGHVVFNVSYVAIVVRARLANMNPHLEEAAYDLGANGWQTFWRITFPQIIPGVLAGALLALTLSLDDYVVTFFNAGPGTTTLPIFVYGLLKTAVTPEINAISTLMLVASTILIVVSLGLQRRSAS
ncbi:MAG: ABC transporter permease [Chloroflexota bacterium]